MPGDPTSAAIAELDDVSVVLDGRTALCDVDLSIGRGSLTALVGPNGAGKSTLLEVLAGVRSPTAGRALIATASRAYVPQRTSVPRALPLTLRDVVLIGAWGRVGPWRRVNRSAVRAVDAAIRTLGLSELQRTPFAQLSGGQQQRALLAQGLARSADLLLLDEPTTALDAVSASSILDAVTTATARGVSVVCATHDPTVTKAADAVIPLRDGRIDVTSLTTRGRGAPTVPRR